MGTLRIIAGLYKNRRLRVPGGRGVRPTGERAREALFSILAPRLAGARVADLYAGSGALGLEALSRGAAFALFVDRDPAHCRQIEENCRALGLGDVYEVRRAVLPRDAARLPRGLDLVFLDPPYGDVAGLAETLTALSAREILTTQGWAVAESDRRAALPPIPGFFLVDKRRYGDTVFSFLAKTVEQR